jgi:hypothetical protein
VTLAGEPVEEPAPEPTADDPIRAALMGLVGDGTPSLERVFALVFPGMTMAASGPRDVADAIRLDTAIRHRASGFITSERTLLEQAWAMETAFDGFMVRAPSRALLMAQKAVDAAERAQSGGAGEGGSGGSAG